MSKLLPLLLLAILTNVPWLKRRAWRWFYQIFATIDPDGFNFMNYGYAGDAAVILDQAEEAEEYSYRLYQHVAEPVDLTGAHVLEVGCGRGGGAFYIHKHHAPARVCGLDISERALRLCRDRYSSAGLEFMAGDAEDLPFPECSFDVVLNVESAFCYPSRANFYAEVQRVLRDGGHFLYADMEKSQHVPRVVEELERNRFAVIRREVINQEVIHACDLDQQRRREFIDSLYSVSWFRKAFYSFAAIPGSLVYEALKDGRLQYFCYVLRKNASTD